MAKVVDPEERFQNHTEEMLCADCEQKLNQYESPFAGRVFHPYQNGTLNSFECAEWLHRFIISVNWRLINSKLSDWDDISSYNYEAIEDAERLWFDILTEVAPLEHDPYTHHVILLDDLCIRTGSDKLPEKWEFYRSRATDGTVVTGVGVHYYFKFPGIAFISCIQPPEITGFRNTQVRQSGKIATPQSVPLDWERFVIQRARRAFEYDVSSGRREQITEWMMERPERAIDSGSFQAWNGNMVRRIENHDPTDYLNKECPICFTDHRVLKQWPSRPITQDEAEEFAETLSQQFVFFEPIFMRDELEHPEAPTNVAPTIVLSTKERVSQISLYTDIGWVVEKDINLANDWDPEEIGERLWRATRRDYVAFANENR